MVFVVSIANMDADTQRTLDGEGNLMIGSLGASVTLGVILFDLLSLIYFLYCDFFYSVAAGLT